MKRYEKGIIASGYVWTYAKTKKEAEEKLTNLLWNFVNKNQTDGDIGIWITDVEKEQLEEVE